MAADYAGITVPCILILNMADVAAAQGRRIDAGLIEQKLGVPVVLFSANDKKGYAPFYNALERAVAEKKTLDTTSLEALYAMIGNNRMQTPCQRMLSGVNTACGAYR